MSVVIRIQNLSKQYRLGLVSTRTLSHDLNRWWQTSILGKEDPYLKIGETNIRDSKGSSEYIWALKDINLEVEEGDILGIIGKNGAGKSTLLKILSKVTAPTTGIIKVKGRLASLLEVGTGFHPEMTGRENIYMNGAIMGMTKKEISQKFDEIVDFAGIERYIDTPVKRYSSGMTVRLAFSVAAHVEPEILVIDEVLAVGDAEFQKKAVGKIQDISSKNGRTVLFVSHNMGALRGLCRKGVLLINGWINYSGEINETINVYLKESKSELRKKIIITDKHRISYCAKDIEFMEIELLNENGISTNEPILINFTLKVNNKSKKEARIIGMLNSITGARVGLFFSPNFNIPLDSDIIIVNLKFKDHNLAKGQYYFDFNVGTGDHTTAITDFDLVYKTVLFEVLYDDYKTKIPIVKWPFYWGNNCYRNVELNLEKQ